MLLILDTHSPDSRCLLADSHHIIAQSTIEGHLLGKNLIKTVDDLLISSDASLPDVTRIAVCTGPGSFTGVRLGLMCAKSWSMALNIELVTFSSLEGYIKYSPKGSTLIEATQRPFCHVLCEGSLQLLPQEKAQHIHNKYVIEKSLSFDYQGLVSDLWTRSPQHPSEIACHYQPLAQ